MKKINAKELESLLEARPAQALLLDVRTPGEYGKASIRGSHLMPLAGLDTAKVMQKAEGKPVIVTCQSGGRAARAAVELEKAGLTVSVLEGGLQGWEQAGMPVVRGTPKGLPLIRQVHILVGALTAVLAGLAYAVSPLWAIGPLLIGLGLVVAGATGFCGMAYVLAKMPWNRAHSEASAACEKKCCASKA